jgi:alpha-mannosidase
LKFEELEQPVTDPANDEEGYLRYPVHPMDHYVACDSGRGGLAVFSQFPMNYEVVAGDEPYMALTLLRAVGMLSVREETLTRGPGAGPDTPTPEAQCLRAFDMSFAVRPYAEDQRSGLFAEALRWRAPVPYGVLWGADPEWSGRDPSEPLLSLGRGPIVVSALKKSHDRMFTVLRLFNSGPVEATTAVRGTAIRTLTPLLLSEAESGEAPIDAGEAGCRVTMPPYSLRSFRVG